MTPRFIAVLLAAGACALAAPVAARQAQEAVAGQPFGGPLHPRTAQTDLPLEGARAAMQLESVEMAMEVFPQTRYLSSYNRYHVLLTGDVDQLQFDLDPRFEVVQVFVDREDWPLAEFRSAEGLLTIDLPASRRAGERIEVDIIYGGYPHAALNAPWEGGFVWDETPDGQPWIATAFQGEGCDLMWPCIDHSSSRVGTVDMHVTVPRGLVAAGNGTLIGTTENDDDTTTFHWRARDPSNYGITLQIAPYEVAQRDHQSRFGNTIALRFWHLPGNAVGAERLLGEMADQIDFMESRFGPYPFGDEKAGVAETPHLGMEHQTINAYGNGYQVEANGYDWLLQHEFAHEWFANQLRNATINHMWLVEGITTWTQPLYLERTRGRMLHDAELWKGRQRVWSRVPLVPPEGTLPDYNDRQAMWGDDIYFKGAWIMHTLRWLVGDEVLFPAVTRLTYGSDDPQPGTIHPVSRTTEDFRAILEELSGRDLEWFFDAYFYQAPLPRLEVTREGTELLAEWRTPSDLPFTMPVEVEMDGLRMVLPMLGGRGRLQLDDPAQHVLLDPENRILHYDPAIEAVQCGGD